jgi:hypothetical protein
MPPAAATARASSARAARVATRRAPARARTRPTSRRAQTRIAPGRTARAHTRPAPRRSSAATAPLRLVPAAVGRTATAVGDIADSGLFIGLVRSRGWIFLLAVLLVGIVALNVVTLSLNSRTSRTAALSDELKRENSALRGDLAGALASERLREKAAELGLAYPAAEAIIDLRADPGDAAAAARRLRSGEIQIGAAESVDPVAPTPETTAVTPTPVPAESTPAPEETVAPTTQATAPAAAETAAPPEAGGGAPTGASGGAIAP